ncbi:lytic murein transglycosylase [Desulfococcaceae bacterium HSG8]|nr:lytic murein transglycosylase [Desulfococcaceae bacterium HSG8]
MLYSRQRYVIFFFIIILIFSSCAPVQISAHADIRDGYFASLQKRLISDGFDKNRMVSLYEHPRAKFNTSGVSSYFMHSESKLNYNQFLERSPIRKAKEYMEIYRPELKAAEKAYGVTGRVITAILLVETRLGTYTGKSSVFNTLSTMAALEDPKVKAMLWKKVSGSTHLTKNEFEEKAEKKSGWAYDELKAFLKYTAKEKISPMNIYGSYAGAMGICQFMPSNILTLAKDGNKDGRIDLFNHADAIMSIASYLNHYGWYPGIRGKQAYDVVYTYNHSKYYVNTILKIAERLKG